jgi:hypothetical protein
MAESTAGIGEAGALVNRAKAPATLDITRGIQMAESNALKKAQLEAAKESKRQALQDRMLKFSEVTPPDMKNAGMARKAQKIGLEASSKLYQAAQTGSPQAVFMAKSEIAKDMNLAKIQDNIVSDLKSDKKYKYVNEIGNLLDDDKLDEVNKLNKPYAPVYAINERGDYKILAPDKIDLNKKYSSVIKDAGKNLIEYKDDADRVAGADNYLLSRQMTKGEIDVATSVFLKDPDNYAGTLYSPDFQKFYDENPKYKGSTEEQKIASGIVDYTKNRIEELNIQKLSPKAKSKGGGGFNFVSGNEGNTKSYKFDRVNYVDGQDVIERLFVEKDGKPVIQFGDPRFDVKAGEKYVSSKNPYVKTDAIKEQIKKSKKANVVQLDQSGQFDLTLTDKDRDDPSRKNTKPLYIIDADDNKYLVYAEGTPNDFSEHIMRFDSEGRLKNALLQYYSKDPSKDIQDVITGLGSNVFRGSNKGGGSTPPPAPTVTAAKFKDMPVAERANFIKKGGKIKG